MPASQSVEYKGFRVRVRPAFWLRRWTRFPLYFQATQPSFEIEAQKVAEEDSPPKPGELVFDLSYTNNTRERYTLDVSSSKVGDLERLITPKVVLAPTGDVSLRLNTEGTTFQTLYAFYVSPEATLVFLVLNAVLGVLLGTAAALILGFR